MVNFPAGTISASFNVSITTDDILERNETFALTIDLTNNVIAGSVNATIVTIVDDDSE